MSARANLTLNDFLQLSAGEGVNGDYYVSANGNSYVFSSDELSSISQVLVVPVEINGQIVHMKFGNISEGSDFKWGNAFQGNDFAGNVLRLVDSNGSFIASGNTKDLILGTSNADIISLPGGTAQDNHDTVLGGASNDYIRGNDGNNLLDGGADADPLLGEDGRDILLGGSGHDTLWPQQARPA